MQMIVARSGVASVADVSDNFAPPNLVVFLIGFLIWLRLAHSHARLNKKISG